MTTAIVRGVERYIGSPNRYEVADVQIEIDLDQIGRRYGCRAMKNKSGKSKFMQGAIVVKVLNRRDK